MGFSCTAEKRTPTLKDVKSQGNANSHVLVMQGSEGAVGMQTLGKSFYGAFITGLPSWSVMPAEDFL